MNASDEQRKLDGFLRRIELVRSGNLKLSSVEAITLDFIEYCINKEKERLDQYGLGRGGT